MTIYTPNSVLPPPNKLAVCVSANKVPAPADANMAPDVLDRVADSANRRRRPLPFGSLGCDMGAGAGAGLGAGGGAALPPPLHIKQIHQAKSYQWFLV